MVTFSGHRTQFYVDIIYGIMMSAGFGYLLLVDMNPVVVAFLGGAVFGYVLRVWENMSVYEQAITARAEEAVTTEAQEAVTAEAQEAVAAEVEEQVDEKLADGVAARINEEVRAQSDRPVDSEAGDAPGDASADAG